MIENYLAKNIASKQDFIIIDNQNISYAKFNKLISDFMQFVQNRNVEIKRLAIDLCSSLDILIAIVACNRLGIAPIIFPPANKRIRNIDYVKISNADFLIHDKNCIIQVNDNFGRNKISNDFRDIQCILFTSGTECEPKAVELTYDNIFASVLAWGKILDFNEKTCYLNVLPLYHISGLSIFFRSLYFGFKSVVLNYNKNFILNHIDKYNVDYVSVVPKMIYDMIDNENIKLLGKKINTLIVGGDGINNRIYNALKINMVNAYISYGMTETSSGIAGYFIAKQNTYKVGYIGDPHHGVKIFLNNNNIAIKSNVVMNKYVNHYPCNDLFISNDIGQIKSDGLYFISRNKHSITSGGENIPLSVINRVIDSYDCIDDYFVAAYKDNQWGEISIVFFETKLKNINNDDLLNYCKGKLPGYMVPKHFIKINKIPYKNNKVDQRLIQYYIERSIT